MIWSLFLIILSSSLVAAGQRCDIPPYIKVADSTNCAGFIQCINHEVRYMSCMGGTLFNTITGLCDFPFNVQCGYRPIKGSTPTLKPFITTTTPVTTTAPPTMSPAKREILHYYVFWYDFHCSHFGDSNTIRWPHPFDCKLFFECKSLKLTQRSCPSSPRQLYFQFEQQNCVISATVNCPVSPPYGTTFVPSEEENNRRKICYENRNSVMRWPYSRDCRRYFQCVYGKFTQEVCSLKPEVMVYSDKILSCRSVNVNDTCILKWKP